jgi:DNA-binding transcriptional regulator YiaG
MICAVCGAALREKTLDRYHYKESGLDNIFLHGGVKEAACPNRHERFIAVAAEPQLLQVITLALLMRPGALSNKELRYARQSCDLTQAQLASAMGLTRRETIAEWEGREAGRRDRATEFLLRAVLLREFKEALEHRVPSHLSPSHFDLLHKFEEAFSRAYTRLSERKSSKEDKIKFTRVEDTVWTPEIKVAA